MRRAVLLLVPVLALGLSNGAGASVSAGGAPTKLAKQAKALGITKAGPKYEFEQQSDSSDILRLTVDLPTAWGDLAESRFVNPDTEERYGVGIRATTDEDLFREGFEVPGVRITAASLTPSQVDTYDAGQVIADNAFEGCQDGKIRAFDNGVYTGSYQAYEECDDQRGHAAVLVVVTGRFIEILVAAQILTKADLKAVDRVLRTLDVERVSI